MVVHDVGDKIIINNTKNNIIIIMDHKIWIGA